MQSAFESMLDHSTVRVEQTTMLLRSEGGGEAIEHSSWNLPENKTATYSAMLFFYGIIFGMMW